jgi:hypothetical protein
MTKPDPSSPLEDDALDFLTENALTENLEYEEQPSVAFTEAPYSAPDEDRLYTDNIIRQNEAASRFLLLSVLGAGVISLGVGIWYFIARNQAQPQQTAPLQVPEQPSFAPLPSLNPGTTTLPNLPLPGKVSPGQALPPSDSGILPENSVEPSTLPSPKTSLPNTSPTPPPPPTSTPR